MSVMAPDVEIDPVVEAFTVMAGIFDRQFDHPQLGLKVAFLGSMVSPISPLCQPPPRKEKVNMAS